MQDRAQKGDCRDAIDFIDTVMYSMLLDLPFSWNQRWIGLNPSVLEIWKIK
jgi:hypothetical protein